MSVCMPLHGATLLPAQQTPASRGCCKFPRCSWSAPRFPPDRTPRWCSRYSQSSGCSGSRSMPRAPGQHASHQGRAAARSSPPGTGSRRCSSCMRFAQSLRQTCLRSIDGRRPGRPSERRCRCCTSETQCYPSTRRNRATIACTDQRGLDRRSSSMSPPCTAVQWERQGGLSHLCPDNNFRRRKGVVSQSQSGRHARQCTDRGTEGWTDGRRNHHRGQGCRRWDNRHLLT